MVGIWGLAALIFMLAVPAPAGAGQRSPAPTDEGGSSRPAPAIAMFEGKKIDLAAGWGEATSCLIWRQGGVMECFRSEALLDAREAQLRSREAATEGSTADSSGERSVWCSSSLRLYEHNWYGGRKLSFWDRGYWQNLADYGFNDRTSSYIVGACYAHLAEHPNGGGWWYPGPTYPWAGEPVMGWQDVISSIYIE
jgi:hypothetical protein